jgi:hypothetical protein
VAVRARGIALEGVDFMQAAKEENESKGAPHATRVGLRRSEINTKALFGGGRIRRQASIWCADVRARSRMCDGGCGAVRFFQAGLRRFWFHQSRSWKRRAGDDAVLNC